MRLIHYLNKANITELAMAKKTKIKYEINNDKTIYVEVELERDIRFYVKILRDTADSVMSFGPTLTKKFGKQLPFDYWTVSFEDEKGWTSTMPKEEGVALELFAALDTIFRKFIKEKNPEVIYFSGWGESKVKLYTLLAKKIAKGIQGDYIVDRGTFNIWKK